MARLTVLMGAPGSGKSTYAKRLGNVVTNDRGGKPGDILHNSYRQINALLAAGKDAVFDTTGANPAVRKAALSIAAKHGAQTAVHVMGTPLDACIKRQAGRPNAVSESEVRRIHAAVEKQRPGLRREGFQNVREVKP